MSNPIQEKVLNELTLGDVTKASTFSSIGYLLGVGGVWLKYRKQLETLKNELKECNNESCVKSVNMKLNQLKSKVKKLSFAAGVTGAVAGAGLAAGHSKFKNMKIDKHNLNITSKVETLQKQRDELKDKWLQLNTEAKYLSQKMEERRKTLSGIEAFKDSQLHDMAEKHNIIIQQMKELKAKGDTLKKQITDLSSTKK